MPNIKKAFSVCKTESRKQQRKLVTWKTDSIYVDVETGEIINKVREIVQTEDIIREPLTKESINDLLEDSGWNSVNRPISEFQMRNLIN